MYTVMVCRLCLKYFEDLIDLFEANDQNVSVAEVVGKHLWFKPQTDDPISTAICNHCRIRLLDFHEFYLMVENAQSQITDGFIVKTEITEICDESVLAKTCEPFDVFGELGEVPINMSFDDELGETTDDATEGKETPRETILNNDFSAEIAMDDKETLLDVLFTMDFSADDNDKDDKNYSHHEDKSDDTHDGQDIVKRINSRNKGNLKGNNSRVNNKSCSDNDKTSEKTKTRNSKNKKGCVPKTGKGKRRRSIKSEEKNNEYDKQIAEFIKLYCQVCYMELENFSALRVHMRDEHNIKKGYMICCNKKFTNRAVLVYHIQQHSNPNCYRCEECDFTFADRQCMRNHFLVKHQKEEDKLFECSECPKKFSRKYLLESHNRFAHSGISTCRTCKKRFKTPEEFAKHNKEGCIAGRMCDICAKVIRGEPAFKRHQLEHQGIEVPKAQCHLCGMWCKHKSALHKHLKRHMESKEPHTCDICQKVLSGRSAMESHRRYAHNSNGKHVCNICQKDFKKALILREHMTVHTGEILYNCKHCPRTFNSNANMHTHLKKEHPKEFEETRKFKKPSTFKGQQQIANGINAVVEEEAVAQNITNDDITM